MRVRASQFSSSRISWDGKKRDGIGLNEVEEDSELELELDGGGVSEGGFGGLAEHRGGEGTDGDGERRRRGVDGQKEGRGRRGCFVMVSVRQQR